MTAAVDCGPGYYSPDGSHDCYVCREGYTCDDLVNGISLTTYLTKTTAGEIGEVYSDGEYHWSDCPLGHYCLSGRKFALPCPIGTIRDTVGATLLSECVDVTGGLYADTPGSYSTIISENYCSPGYMCSAGATSKFHIPCPPGQYQDEFGKDVCKLCPAGNFCLGATVHPVPCPAGYYCLIGNVDPNHTDNFPKACEIGTYGGQVGLTADTECTDCTAGSYCAEPGAQSPTGKCDAGYLCYGKSTTPRPTDTITGEICPVGGYCEIGSSSQKACEGGYYNPDAGKKTVFDCVECTPGSYCQGQALPNVSGPCDAGWYCGAASTVKEQFPAEPGYYAEEGSSEQTQCLVGTYNNLWHQGECMPCTEGFYCANLGTSELADENICPVGMWCAEGVGIPTLCGIGTYNPTTHATRIEDCLPCPAGYYCS